MDRVFDSDPLTQTKRTFHYDDTDESFVIATQQDCESIVETNKALQNSQDERTGWKGTWHRVASIPNVVWWDLVRRGIANDDKALKKWLRDPSNRFFRTKPGRL